jgi:Ca2+-binding RTX toxin-like protein
MTSYIFKGSDIFSDAGYNVDAAGNIDGDNKSDLLISAVNGDLGSGTSNSGDVFLVTGYAIPFLDAADGEDGIVDLTQPNITGVYRFSGTTDAARLGESLAFVEDFDGDLVDDIFIGASNSSEGASSGGIGYLVSSAELDILDAADGVSDHVIDLSNILSGSLSYVLTGAGASDRLGTAAASLGYLDGSSFGSFAFTAPNATFYRGEVHVVAGESLDSADAADGTSDRSIDVDNIAGQSGSFTISGLGNFNYLGSNLEAAGDVGGDGDVDFLVRAGQGEIPLGDAFLIDTSMLAIADAADGTSDGLISIDNAVGAGVGYGFLGNDGSPGDSAGLGLGAAGDYDSDGKDDFFISASTAQHDGENYVGTAYLIMSAGLAAMDLADGTVDGVIDLDNVAGTNVGGKIRGYALIGESIGSYLGMDVTAIGDFDDDGIEDYLIDAAAANNIFGPGKVYLLSGAALPLADAADGLVDGVVEMENVQGIAGSYILQGGHNNSELGISVQPLGDMDGDGRVDFWLGETSLYHSTDRTYTTGGFLISAAELSQLDALDGAIDFEIDTAQFYRAEPFLTTADPAGEELSGLWRDDTLLGQGGDDTLNGSGGGDSLSGGSGEDILDGGPGGDTLTGGRGNDVAYGGEGPDEIYGGGQADDLYGGYDDDTLNGDNGTDTVRGEQGEDYVQGGNHADLLFGGEGHDTLLGGDGVDELRGDAGNDVLYGGAGDDWLIGGVGSDTIHVDDEGDRVSESRNWAGNDMVVATIDYRLGSAHVENLRLEGAAIIGAGNGLANRLTGNDQDNILDGGKNNDTMWGGLGDDTYLIRAPSDMAIENAGEGMDAVRAFRSYALEAHIEQLHMQNVFTRDGAPANLNGIGNGIANTIIGTPYANTLIGREGRDTLKGQGGADTFVFDRAIGPSNVDRIIDFNVGGGGTGDILKMKGAEFGGMSAGALTASAFVAGTSAADADDRFIFDQASGQLWFDDDGTGSAAQVLIATFEQNANVTETDILIF